MISIQPKQWIIAFILLILLFLTTGAYYPWNQNPVVDEAQSEQDNSAYFTCPMHPSVKAKVPGSCPICSMDLIVVEHRSHTQSPGSVVVDGKKRQLIGVTTKAVNKQTFSKFIKAAGKVNYDESLLTEITLKYDAWIETLQAYDVGVRVNKGQPLFSVYSPDLVSAQQEYLMSLQSGGRYKQAGRQRLEFWGVNSNQLKQLRDSGRVNNRFPIISPVSGIIIKKNIINGSAVKAGAPLLVIADLAKVWVEADIYQNELAWVKKGMNAKIIIDDLPGKQWVLPITSIDPFLDAKSHSARIKFELDNSDHILRADMYASIYLKVDRGEHLLVPESAVLFSGEKRIVFVDKGQGRLEPREITIGLQNNQFMQVLDGLQAGDHVVTSGQFLIASESKLKSGISQW